MLLRLERNNRGRKFFLTLGGKAQYIECGECGIIKHESEYDTHTRLKYGKQVYCKPCDHVIRKENLRKQKGGLR
jgi:hypothetical protein